MRLSRAALAAAVCGLLAGGPVRAGTVSLTGPDSAEPGGTVNVAVTLSPDMSGVYALQAGLTYDPTKLTMIPSPESVVPQGFHAGTPGFVFPGETIPKDADLFRLNANTVGQVLFGYVKNPGDPAGSPSFAVPSTAVVLTFQVAPEAAGSTTVQLAPYTVNGQNLPPVLAGTKDGTQVEAVPGPALVIQLSSVPMRRPGDADDNGEVTVDDVIIAMQFASGLQVTAGASNIGNADVAPSGARDGIVDLTDAVLILRFLNHLEAALQ